MKHSISAALIVILISSSSLAALAQGISEGASLWGAGGLGAGVGVAAGSKGTKNISTSAKALSDRLNRAAAQTYQQAVAKQKAGKHADAAKLMASYAAQRQRIYGVSDSAVVKSYDTAAAFASKAGLKSESEQYERKGLDVCTKRFGTESPVVKQREARLGISHTNAAEPPVETQSEPTEAVPSESESTTKSN